ILKEGESPTFIRKDNKTIVAVSRDWWDRELHKNYINEDYVQKITLTLAIKWIFENYGIWISVNFANKNQWYFDCSKFGTSGKEKNLYWSNYDFNSSQEAYQAAISYTLLNLIK
nr:hypothetical protein [Burkholderiales bacterium]